MRNLLVILSLGLMLVGGLLFRSTALTTTPGRLAYSAPIAPPTTSSLRPTLPPVHVASPVGARSSVSADSPAVLQ